MSPPGTLNPAAPGASRCGWRTIERCAAVSKCRGECVVCTALHCVPSPVEQCRVEGTPSAAH